MSFFESVIKYLPYVGLAGFGLYLANKNIARDPPREYIHAGELVMVDPNSDLGKHINDLDRQEEISLIKSCEAEIRAGNITRKDMAKRLKLYMMLYYESGREYRLLNYYMEKLEKS